MRGGAIRLKSAGRLGIRGEGRRRRPPRRVAAVGRRPARPHRAAPTARRGIRRASIRCAGVVEATEYQGSYVKVTLDVGGGIFVANISDGAYFAEPVDAGRSGRRQLEDRRRAHPDQGRHRRRRRSVSRRRSLERQGERRRSKIRPRRHRRRPAKTRKNRQRQCKGRDEHGKRPCARAKYLLFGSVSAGDFSRRRKQDLA